ncbi:2523_t:CDS:2 [Funneliformis geosporum]|uniref:2523_t:CDS:1 n=1 Tax=Funneliformis geosporum TaxID=1117311 RepID=A0A9W4SL46_9GLOM|nr:2523_t:CDS:2 [Funneliformis geosporum]
MEDLVNLLGLFEKATTFLSGKVMDLTTETTILDDENNDEQELIE